MSWILIAAGLLLVVGVLSPVLASFDRSFLRINGKLHMTQPREASPYGLCADLCATDGTCRHVLVPDGWHHTQHVSDETLAAAVSCH